MIIIDNDFGPDFLKGRDAIQIIREQERRASKATPVVIALWTAEEAIDAPGATLIWNKAVSTNQMKAELSPHIDIM